METTAKPVSGNRIKTPILIIGGIIILAMTYGSGMRAQVRKIKAVDEKRKLAEQDYRGAQRDLHLRLAVARQLEARRQVALALTELDNRNFGSAQDHLKQSAEQLADADAEQTSAPDLSPITTPLKQINLVAAADISGQRQTLLTIAKQMDEALNPAVPTFLDSATKFDTTHPIQMPTMNDVPLLPGNDVTRTE